MIPDTIELDAILSKFSRNYKLAVEEGRQDMVIITGKEARAAITEAVRQALEIAAKKNTGKLDKQSVLTIINVINLIK